MFESICGSSMERPLRIIKKSRSSSRISVSCRFPLQNQPCSPISIVRLPARSSLICGQNQTADTRFPLQQTCQIGKVSARFWRRTMSSSSMTATRLDWIAGSSGPRHCRKCKCIASGMDCSGPSKMAWLPLQKLTPARVTNKLSVSRRDFASDRD